MRKMSKSSYKILCYPSNHTVVVKIRERNHKIQKSGDYFMRRVRGTYQRVTSHTHHKLELVSKGFLISKSKPSLMPVWAILIKCQCSDGCPNKVLESKCPWKHRDMGSEEAFLILKIGGVVSEKGFALKPSSQYYFQLQLQMFVSKLSLNILVVWTKKGVFAVDVPLNPSFMTKTCVPSLRCFCLSSFSLSWWIT